MIFDGRTLTNRCGQLPGPGLFSASLMVFVLLASSVYAQDDLSRVESPVSAELLSLKIAEVESSTTLDEQTAKSLVEFYRKSLTNLERARVEQDSANALVAAAADALGETANVNREQEQLRFDNPANAVVPDNQTLSELEQLLTEEKSRLNDAEANLTRLRERLTTEASRPGPAREQLTEARKQLDETLDELNAPAPIGEAPEFTEARRW